MSHRLLAAVGVLLVVAGILAMGSFFIVDQPEQALVLQFGEVRRMVREPGLKMKWPLIENVVEYDKRVLDFEPPHEEVIVADQKRLVADTYTRYRITNALLFYQTVGTEEGVRARLSALVSGSLRRVLGNVTLNDVLSEKRAAIMRQIRDDVAGEAKGFGIEVVDVRLRRADLPEENSQAIYARMQSEREQQARQYRGEGAERARQCRAGTHGDPGRGAARFPAGARRWRCAGGQALCRRLWAGQGVLRLLSLAAGLSRGAQWARYLFRAGARRQFLPLFRWLAEITRGGAVIRCPFGRHTR